MCADDPVSLCADDSFAMCADDLLSMCANDPFTCFSMAKPRFKERDAGLSVDHVLNTERFFSSICWYLQTLSDYQLLLAKCYVRHDR